MARVLVASVLGAVLTACSDGGDTASGTPAPVPMGGTTSGVAGAPAGTSEDACFAPASLTACSEVRACEDYEAYKTCGADCLIVQINCTGASDECSRMGDSCLCACLAAYGCCDKGCSCASDRAPGGAPAECSSDSDCAPDSVCDAGACTQVCGDNAFATPNMQCVCRVGFEFASSDPSDTNCVPSQGPLTPAPGCQLFAQDDEHTYLGDLGDCYDASSICNKYGSYGSPYGADSIFNEYGTYGSPYGAFSAFNDYSTQPPQLICDGEVAACVTTNKFACSGTDLAHPSSLCSCP